MAPKPIKHDQYVDDLCEQIRDQYEIILRHVPLYSHRRRLIGEVDVLAFRDNYCDIYEVKCSYRISKARRQLEKFTKILSKGSNVRNGFFFCGASGTLLSV